VYLLITETWSLSSTPPEREHFQAIVEGVRLFPREAGLIMQATLLAAKCNFREEAVSLARLGARVAAEQGERDRFQLMASAFSRDAAAEPAPKSEDAPKAETTLPYLLKVP